MNGTASSRIILRPIEPRDAEHVFALNSDCLLYTSMDAWRALGLWSGGAALASTVYAALLWWRRGAVHALYGALVFLVHVPLLWCIGENMSLLFPSDIPRWMMPAEPELYALSLVHIL